MLLFKAGISEKRLRLALEPEAASIYTREILLERSSTEDQELSPVFRQGMKYIVIDLGGVSIFIFRSYVMLMFL